MRIYPPGSKCLVYSKVRPKRPSWWQRNRDGLLGMGLVTLLIGELYAVIYVLGGIR